MNPILPGIWQDETVAIFATGPSMSAEAAESCRGMRTIAIKESGQLAPWADVLLAYDASWWMAHPEALAFPGLKISGQETACDGVVYVPTAREKVRLREGWEVEIASAGLMAVRMALGAGATRLVLFGFDGGTGHWFGTGPFAQKIPDKEVYAAACASALKRLQWEMGLQGIKIEHGSLTPPAPPPDLDAFRSKFAPSEEPPAARPRRGSRSAPATPADEK